MNTHERLKQTLAEMTPSQRADPDEVIQLRQWEAQELVKEFEDKAA